MKTGVRYQVDPKPFVEIGGDGTAGDPILQSVFSATKTPAGFVVAETGAEALLFLDARGKLLHTAGRQGQGPGEFMGGIFVYQCAGDSLFTWDSRTMRVAVFSAAGKYVRQFPAYATYFKCSRAGVGAMLLRPSARGAAADGTNLRVSSIKVVNLTGDSIGGVSAVPWGENRQFGASTTISVRGEEIYVGTGREPAVDVYDRHGAKRRRISFPHTPVPITKEARERAVDGMLDYLKVAGPDRAAQRATMLAQPSAETYPVYREIAVAPNGLVWLITTPMSDSVAHLQAVQDDGKVVSTMDLKGGMVRLLEAGDEYLLLTHVTDEGDMKVGAFRVRRVQ